MAQFPYSTLLRRPQVEAGGCVVMADWLLAPTTGA